MSSTPPITPTLGCQIAPHYNHDYDSGSSSDISSDEEEEEELHEDGAQVQREESDQTDLDKVETQQEVAAIRTSTRPTLKARTRSSRRGQPEPSVGFFHWKMAGVRLHVLTLWCRTNLILAGAILALLSMFWGALLNQEKRIGNLEVLVVDFDGHGQEGVDPFVGPFVTQHIQDMVFGEYRLGYSYRRPEEFDNDYLKVHESVYDFHAWAAVIIHSNATAELEAAVRGGSKDYDPQSACSIIVNTARDPSTTSSYVMPSLNMIQKSVVSNFGSVWIPRLLENSSESDLDLGAVPQAVSPGIEFKVIDLRPFGPPIATPATSIGLIYLIILSFFSFTFFLPIHLKYLSPRGHPPLHFTHLIIWRYLATVVSYFLLSCVYSLVSLMFLFPFTNDRKGSHVSTEVGVTAYGKATWIVYWMVNWLGMAALGLASENMAMLLGTPWTAIWLIFWVITNVSTGFYAIDLENRFFRWGYAWPIHNVAEATRQILFDLHPRIGLNLGILVVWVVIGTALFPLCCFYMRWNTIRVKKAAAAKDAAWQQQMEKEREDPSLLARITTAQRKPA